MRFEAFEATNTLVGEIDRDPHSLASRFAALWSAINEITPLFRRPWRDLGWYAENKGLKPWEYLALDNPEDVLVLYQRSDTLQLISQSDPAFEFFGYLGGLGYTESDFRIYCSRFHSEWSRADLDSDAVVEVFSSVGRRRIIEEIASIASPYMCAHALESSGIERQIDLPEIWEDFEANAAAVGPRWDIHLGWFTYLDMRFDIPLPTDVSWPAFVTVRPFHHGITIQIGDDAAAVTPAMIAQVRKALGWEFIRADLET